MNTFDKIKKICAPFRIIIGLVLIIAAFIFDNNWLYLGVIPLIAGLTKFCPLCILSKKCTI